MSIRTLPSRRRQTAIRAGLLFLAAGGLSLTGCQVDVGGQTALAIALVAITLRVMTANCDIAIPCCDDCYLLIGFMTYRITCGRSHHAERDGYWSVMATSD
jgi:hypothetical protein